MFAIIPKVFKNTFSNENITGHNFVSVKWLYSWVCAHLLVYHIWLVTLVDHSSQLSHGMYWYCCSVAKSLVPCL